jgi:hypothetical protein
MRSLRLSWLDAAAALCSETDELAEVRARLDVAIGPDIVGIEGRRKTIDVLLNIWLRSREAAPDLRDEAVRYFQVAAEVSDRVWLHYGLCLLRYPVFREVAAAIGQLSRSEQAVTAPLVKQRLVAARGQIASLIKAVEKILFSLRDWGILSGSARGGGYRPNRSALSASTTELETWLLACALRAHPARELPVADLLRLPELFPFRFAVSADDLRRCPRLVVQRQGGGWDVVRTASDATASGNRLGAPSARPRRSPAA